MRDSERAHDGRLELGGRELAAPTRGFLAVRAGALERLVGTPLRLLGPRHVVLQPLRFRLEVSERRLLSGEAHAKRIGRVAQRVDLADRIRRRLGESLPGTLRRARRIELRAGLLQLGKRAQLPLGPVDDHIERVALPGDLRGPDALRGRHDRLAGRPRVGELALDPRPHGFGRLRRRRRLFRGRRLGRRRRGLGRRRARQDSRRQARDLRRCANGREAGENRQQVSRCHDCPRHAVGSPSVRISGWAGRRRRPTGRRGSRGRRPCRPASPCRSRASPSRGRRAAAAASRPRGDGRAPRRRRAGGAGASATSSSIMSPFSTSASGPPAAASGAVCSTTVP